MHTPSRLVFILSHDAEFLNIGTPTPKSDYYGEESRPASPRRGSRRLKHVQKLFYKIGIGIWGDRDPKQLNKDQKNEIRINKKLKSIKQN